MPARRWIAVLCVAVVLFAAITLNPASGLWYGIIATLCFLFAVVISPIRVETEHCQFPLPPFLAILLTRAPPLN